MVTLTKCRLRTIAGSASVSDCTSVFSPLEHSCSSNSFTADNNVSYRMVQRTRYHKQKISVAKIVSQRARISGRYHTSRTYGASKTSTRGQESALMSLCVSFAGASDVLN